jgi:hypothetical protein
VTEIGVYLIDSTTEPGPTILYGNFSNRRLTESFARAKDRLVETNPVRLEGTSPDGFPANGRENASSRC